MAQCPFVAVRCGSPRPPILTSANVISSLLYAIILTWHLLESVAARKLSMRRAAYFPINSFVLAALGAATTIPSDVTGSAPGVLDQVLKLTSIFLSIITIDLSMSSISLMSLRNVLSNVTALGAQLVVVFLDVSYLTCSVTLYKTEQTLFLLVMLLLFVLLLSHGVTVPAVNKWLDDEYGFRGKMILQKWKRKPEFFTIDTCTELSDALENYWLMVVTSNPNHALARSGLPLVSAMLTWGLVGSTFLWRVLLPFLRLRRREWGCYVRSDYDRFAAAVLFFHLVAILVAFLAALFQGLYSNPIFAHITDEGPSYLVSKGAPGWVKLGTYCNALFDFRYHRLQLLVKWGKLPPARYRRSNFWKLVAYSKNLLADLLKLIFLAPVLASNFLLMILAIVWLPLSKLFAFRGHRRRLSREDREKEVKKYKGYDLRLGKRQMVPQSWLRFPGRWMMVSGRSKAVVLRCFLEEYSFKETKPLARYTNNVKDAATSERPLRSWTLTIVTLAKVIRANFHNIKDDAVLKKMTSAVEKAMTFTKMVDSQQRGSKKILDAARVVWESDIDDPRNWWFGVSTEDLLSRPSSSLVQEESSSVQESSGVASSSVQEESSGGASSSDPITTYKKEKSSLVEVDNKGDEELTIIGKLESLLRKPAKKTPLKWTEEKLANNCLYEITRSIKQRSQSFRPSVGDSTQLLKPFLHLLANLIVASLTKLPIALISECSRGGTFLERERAVKSAIFAFEDTGAILKFLGDNKDQLYKDPVKHYRDNWDQE